MVKTAASAVLVCVGLLGPTLKAQAPATEATHLLVDALRTRSRLTRNVNLNRVRERLVEAGLAGYRLEHIAGFSSSMNLLLRRDDAGPRVYRLIASGREGSFMNDLNEAGAEGFRALPGGIKAFEDSSAFGNTAWVAVMVRDAESPRPYIYSLVKGTADGEAALSSASSDGRALVAVVGRQGMVSANTHLFFEQSDGASDQAQRPAVLGYRIIATARTSTMEKDIQAAAAEGYRIVAAGFGHMTVVMARSVGEPAPVDYRVIAMLRRETAIEELRAAGAEGYRFAAASQNGQEGVFVLQRAQVAGERMDFDVLSLEEDSADRQLFAAESEGYRVVQLLNDLVVLERSRAPSARP